MSISDRWSSEDDYIDCADEEETWDLIREVLESAKDQLPYWSLEATGVSSAYSLLKDGQFAKCAPIFSRYIKNLELGIKFWQTKGRGIICSQFECEPKLLNLNLTKKQNSFVKKQAFLTGLRELEQELGKMKTAMIEAQEGLMEWGDRKPITARFEEYKRVKHTYWMNFFKYAFVATILACALGILLAGYSIWLIIIPVIAYLYILNYLFLNVSLITGEMAADAAYDDELKEYAMKHNLKL